MRSHHTSEPSGSTHSQPGAKCTINLCIQQAPSHFRYPALERAWFSLGCSRRVSTTVERSGSLTRTANQFPIDQSGFAIDKVRPTCAVIRKGTGLSNRSDRTKPEPICSPGVELVESICRSPWPSTDNAKPESTMLRQVAIVTDRRRVDASPSGLTQGARAPRPKPIRVTRQGVACRLSQSPRARAPAMPSCPRQVSCSPLSNGRVLHW
ncbi:hypothetical protein BKP42_45000 [Rhodococcus erythropolis]|nr:hypothetical protein BKP42_45000 [Rhodococcus erythropolis]